MVKLRDFLKRNSTVTNIYELVILLTIKRLKMLIKYILHAYLNVPIPVAYHIHTVPNHIQQYPIILPCLTIPDRT